MADLTIVAASVKLSAGVSTQYRTVGTANAAITAGQLIYLSGADSLLYLADANASDVAAEVVGMALANVAAGQPLPYAIDGADVDVGSILTQGATYIASATPGGVCPIADLASGSYLSFCGYAVSPTKMRLMVVPTGVLKP